MSQDTSKVHGSPIGAEEIRLTKEAIGLPPDEAFFVPDGIYEFFSQAMERGRRAHAEWTQRNDEEPSATATVRLENPGFDGKLATRAASGKLFSQIAEKVPGFIGGSADLVESTKTVIEHGRLFSRDDREARDIAFGIREHAMAAIVNGMAVHGGLRPYGATFFVFSDYMRPAVRLGALMKAPSIWVWTHDSVFLGEDGPTHQPIEHLASLRAMPNLWVVRPADANETVDAWEMALNRLDGPTALILTRQNLPVLDRRRSGVERGGYVLRPGNDAVLVATGSEVHVALSAAELLEDIDLRVVSLPCWEAFFEQDAGYRSEVLGDGLPIASLEAGSTFGWEQITGSGGLSLGIDGFGASAPAEVIAEKLGFTPERVAARIKEWLEA